MCAACLFLMSVAGQSRRFGDVRVTSALPLIADVRRENREVRKVPNLEVAPVFNRLVDRRDKRGQDQALQPRSSVCSRPEPAASRKAESSTAIDRARFMIISAFVACCCLMTGYPRLAVPSLRSIRLRTELTIARRTNAISEWAFRHRNVSRHAPYATT